MYVCVCNSINERQLKQAVDEGIVSIGKLKRHLGFNSCCGKCTDCMRNLIEQRQQHSELSCQQRGARSFVATTSLVKGL